MRLVTTFAGKLRNISFPQKLVSEEFERKAMIAATVTQRDGQFSGRFEWAGYALGFGIGGFFDGILLHQVLQWHHLLSGVEQARQDIRVLILWDGIFHVLMYVIAGIGLWLLWRTRNEFPAAGADRRLFTNALIGFGVWHILDSILSHWMLGIHRIRMDVDNPLFWDLLWFAVLGLGPLAIGLMMRRGSSSGSDRVMSSPLALVLAALIAGPISALPPADQTQVVVLFRQDLTEQQAVAAILAVDGRMIGSDASGQIWAVDMASGGHPSELYRYGALLVSNSLLPLGCFNWTRA
ncbi:DUF2243 domain-containing protein [Rhizobium halophilum]|uniref:DUF2243 domain-containing protein n=1 Tax=Rhizobium halophilum TaxID=2846852 RepID=UPI001EFEE224|nr:DUF2243 domain-containing protein [Rhizobium halophilum]MCF6368267.1 DUF2243 domain-containing protein [Rhizobium halophilum]